MLFDWTTGVHPYFTEEKMAECSWLCQNTNQKQCMKASFNLKTRTFSEKCGGKCPSIRIGQETSDRDVKH